MQPLPGLDDLVEGTMVTPSIRLVRMLGRGGMGTVWVADHLTLATQVAVKLICPELATRSPRMAQRFEREARLAARIKSPHAVQTYDHGITASGTPYIVMELLEGETLTARIERYGVLSVREVQLILAQTCEVLARAHALGVVHRDIKPDNIFCVDTGYEVFIKILDFGVAKDRTLQTASNMTSTGAVLGTPRYMSPEQVQSAKDTDHRADLWALAITAYEALTGQSPFHGETLGALIIKIFHADFALPSAIRPDLPTCLDGWFRRALDPDVARRYQSARELADAFHGVLTSSAFRSVSEVSGDGASEPRPTPLPAQPEAPVSASTPPPHAAGTFAGAASTMDLHKPRRPGAGKVMAIGTGLLGLVVAALVGRLVWWNDEQATMATPPASSAAPEEEPEATGTAALPTDGPGPTAGSATEDSPSASSGSALARSEPPSPTRPAQPIPSTRSTATSAALPKIDCSGDGALIRIDGKLKVRPECRRRQGDDEIR